MKKLSLFLSMFIGVILCYGQNLILENKILKSENNNYHITTSIKCDSNPGVLRLAINVPDEYNFKLFNDPNLLIDSRGQTIKFYANFDSGNEVLINYQLKNESSDGNEAVLNVKLEYTKEGNMVSEEKELMLSHHEVVELSVMDSVTNHYASISEQYENRDEIALAKMKSLNEETKSKDNEDEETSMAIGYNSNASTGLNNTGKTYSVQILSLQYFNESRFNDFLSMCGLKASDTYKKEVNGVVKIYVGKYNSYEEAKNSKENLRDHHNLSDSFIVSF